MMKFSSDFSGFGPDPNKSKFEVYATVPKITINGRYKIDGRVLVLPIRGNVYRIHAFFLNIFSFLKSLHSLFEIP